MLITLTELRINIMFVSLHFISIFICLGLWAHLYANAKICSLIKAITWKILFQLDKLIYCQNLYNCLYINVHFAHRCTCLQMTKTHQAQIHRTIGAFRTNCSANMLSKRLVKQSDVRFSRSRTVH